MSLLEAINDNKSCRVSLADISARIQVIFLSEKYSNVFNRNRYFKNYKVEELKLMRIAARFSSNYRPDLKATELLYQLNRAIEERVNYNVPAVIFGAIMLIIIIAIYSIFFG